MKRVPAFCIMFLAGFVFDRFIVERYAIAQTWRPNETLRRRPSLAIGSIPVTISLGMTRDEIADALSSYTVTGKDSGRALITTKPAKQEGDVTINLLGSIWFQNGRAIQISRNWGKGQGGEEIEDFWRACWGAVTSRAGLNAPYMPVSIRANLTHSPEVESQQIDILLDAHHSVALERITSSPPLVSVNSATVFVEEIVF